MPTKSQEDQIEMDRLRAVGRRGATLSVEQTIGVIVEETANGLEGLSRRLAVMEKTCRRLLVRVLDGDEEANIASFADEMEAAQRDLAHIQKQLKESGHIRRTNREKVWEIVRDLLKIVGGALTAVLLWYLKTRYGGP